MQKRTSPPLWSVSPRASAIPRRSAEKPTFIRPFSKSTWRSTGSPGESAPARKAPGRWSLACGALLSAFRRRVGEEGRAARSDAKTLAQSGSPSGSDRRFEVKRLAEGTHGLCKLFDLSGVTDLQQSRKGVVLFLVDVSEHRLLELLSFHAELRDVAGFEQGVELKREDVRVGGLMVEMLRFLFAVGKFRRSPGRRGSLRSRCGS